MATPTTMPALTYTEGQVYVLRKGTDVIGQALSVQLQSNIPTRKLARIGDTNKSTSYAPAEHTANIQMYSEFDPDQLAKMLGGTQKPTTGGWVGTETLYLNPSVAAYDLFVDVYDAATDGSDVLQGTWTISSFKPSSLSVPIQADNAIILTLNGECTALTYSPEAGIGA